MPDRHGRVGRVPRARLPPDRDLRGLRRHGRRDRASQAPTRARPASALGIAGSFAGGLFAYLEDGTPTKPMHPAWAAHGRHPRRRASPRSGRPGRRACSRASSGSTTRSSAPRRARSTSPASSADLGSRWETPRIAYKPYPVCHFMHGSLGATAEAVLGRTLSPGEIDDIVVPCPRPAFRSCSSRRSRSGRRAPSTRASSRSSTRSAAMLVRGHVARRRLHRGGDRPIRPCSPWRRRCATRRGSTRRTRRRSPAASASARRRDDARGRLPVPEGRAREPAVRPTRCARSSARTPRSPVPEAAGALEEAVLALEEQDDIAALAPLLRTLKRRDRMSGRPSGGDRRRRPRVRRRDVIPVASELEHADEFPETLVETMKEMGLFGTTIPEEYGGLGLGLDTYALIVMELSRGWVTLSGILNGSFIAATMIRLHGTEEQRRATCRAWRRRAPRRVLDDRAARRLGRPVDPHDGRPRRRRLRHHGPEDVGDERLARRASSCCSRRPTRRQIRRIAA